MSFDVRALTDDQRSIADDIASAMGLGHEDGCAVWWEDPDGCSCALLTEVANALHTAGIVEVVAERGYDPATRRGDRLQRHVFDPHPLTPSMTDEEAERWMASNDLYAVTHLHESADCVECVGLVEGRAE